MKKTLLNLSLILIIFPATIGDSNKVSCDKSNRQSEKQIECNNQETDEPEEINKEESFSFGFL